MKKTSFFDTLYLLSLLAALFSVGYRIGSPQSDYLPIEFTVSVHTEKLSGNVSIDQTVFIDGKYEAYILARTESEITLLCQGYYSEAGYLLSGAKYLSENQPLKASAPSVYIEGRISLLSVPTDQPYPVFDSDSRP